MRLAAQLRRLLRCRPAKARRSRNRPRRTTTSASTIVGEIERKIADAAIRPVLFYPVGASCMQPYVKGLTIMVNSIYNGWRMEDVWLDR